MPPAVAVSLLLLMSYLVGAVPFGYLVGRLRGVDLFKLGSGNIGATNAGRVLGCKFGLLVFALDFLKGAVPVAVIVPLAEAIEPGSSTALGPTDVLRVGAALSAFLGHLFPVYLGFRGGKGVATGAGTIAVLVPGPAALAVLTWVVVVLAGRMVSLASLAAVTMLVSARLLFTPAPLGPGALPVTLYLLVGAGFVVLKHRGNLARILAGTESRIGDFPVRDTLVRGLHVLALGMWFGGAAFFNAVAPAIFQSFEHVVYTNPSDRTANETIIPADADPQRMKNLASALAGAAVGPVFPRLFVMETVCGTTALLTALSWWHAGAKVHRRRVYVIALALATVLIGWPLSNYVSELRPLRYSTDKAAADAAIAAFGQWHLVSLLLSFVTVLLAGVALALAAKLPDSARSPAGRG